MEPERDEVYERIPWETLERKGGDRQWLAYAVAGAVVVGALAYSFTRNQPVAPVTAAPPVVATAPAATIVPAPVTPPSTVASPLVVAEADLFAIDPERLVDAATTHAVWLAVEYVSVDGTEESREVLASLLPSGLPLPDAPEDVQVYVDWAGAASVAAIGQTSYDVEVIVRSLVSTGGGAFVRQRPYRVGVTVEVGEDGATRATGAPTIAIVEALEPTEITLGAVPEDVLAVLGVDGEVVGGRQRSDGGWDVVVMMTGVDGVNRPVTVASSP